MSYKCCLQHSLRTILTLVTSNELISPSVKKSFVLFLNNCVTASSRADFPLWKGNSGSRREGLLLTALAQSLASPLRHSVVLLEVKAQQQNSFHIDHWSLDIKKIFCSYLQMECEPVTWRWNALLQTSGACSVCVHPTEHFFCIKKQINLSLRLILFVSEVNTIFKSRGAFWDDFYILSWNVRKNVCIYLVTAFSVKVKWLHLT